MDTLPTSAFSNASVTLVPLQTFIILLELKEGLHEQKQYHLISLTVLLLTNAL